jgi:DNA (cytosine-5)-methyltransferase 1
METSKKSTGETLFDLTSYVADTPVSLFQQQVSETAQTTHDTFGLGSEKPLAFCDQSTQSWRTYEDTFLSDLTLFSGKWPASGMTQNGKLFPQPQLVRLIVEIVSSSWPTPRNSSAMSEDMGTIRERLQNGKPYKSRLEEAIALAPTPSGNWPTPTVSDIYADNLKSSQQTDGSMHSVSLAHAVQMWPTPTASVDTSNLNGKFNSLTLWDAVRMWPTPTTQEVEHPEAELTETGRRKSKDGETSHSLGLADAVQMWPTMTANGMGSSGHRELLEKHVNSGDITQDEKKQMSAGNGGRLNPMWVEWLMGFPLGWTDLEDLETL